ncbi:MAG: hypothetical protein KatS3mg053_0089 [Candidatus Roseilinea sp.]|nr:MAG: hypothetical protein KatS3mg053_0089 [Candidatus Roseilinea sp.]
MDVRDTLPSIYLQPRAFAIPSAGARREHGFFQALQSTASVFAQHPLPVVACAFLCFAGAGVIGSLVYGTMIGEAVIRTGSHTMTTMRAYNTQMLVQALIGAFTFLLGRGALTWIAMQEERRGDKTVTLRAALKAALSAWRPLALSTALYGVLITIGLLGLSAMLRELRLDVSNTRSIRIGDFSNILHWTVIRAISLLPPDPGSPFSDWLAATRYNLSRSMVGSYMGFGPSSAPRVVAPGTVAVGLASIALLIATDALLCMRTAAIFATLSPASSSAWLREALRVSKAHLAHVLLWRWSLRLTFVAFAVAAFVLTPALQQVLVVGPARQMLGVGYWPYHIAQSANGVAIALVNGALIAASVIFEARMYKTLAR